MLVAGDQEQVITAVGQAIGIDGADAPGGPVMRAVPTERSFMGSLRPLSILTIVMIAVT